MIQTQDIQCPYCLGSDLQKNGHNENGTQRWRCVSCSKCFQLSYRYKARKPGVKPHIAVLTNQISECVEKGKVNTSSPYPPQMKGQPGADELTRQALDEGASPGDILNLALIPAMNRVGQKYTANEIFVPQMLLSAKAMSASMAHLKPFFQSGEVKRKGVFIMGTVMGDLHDIGKNLCCMMVEGAPLGQICSAFGGICNAAVPHSRICNPANDKKANIFNHKFNQ